MVQVIQSKHSLSPIFVDQVSASKADPPEPQSWRLARFFEVAAPLRPIRSQIPHIPTIEGHFASGRF